jgi:protein-arginine kinase activator protein McsA
MSKWEEWKKAQGETRPWHLLDHSKLVDDPKITENRMEICKECPFYFKATTQCKKCGCAMALKTKLEAAACPIGKW